MKKRSTILFELTGKPRTQFDLLKIYRKGILFYEMGSHQRLSDDEITKKIRCTEDELARWRELVMLADFSVLEAVKPEPPASVTEEKKSKSGKSKTAGPSVFKRKAHPKNKAITPKPKKNEKGVKIKKKQIYRQSAREFIFPKFDGVVDYDRVREAGTISGSNVAWPHNHYKQKK